MLIVTDGGELPRIDPDKIPETSWNEACRLLKKSIDKFLQDPKNRAEFEAWKAERAVAKGAQ